MRKTVTVSKVLVAQLEGIRIWIPGVSSTWQLLVKPTATGGDIEMADVSEEAIETYVSWWFGGAHHRPVVKLRKGWRIEMRTPVNLFTSAAA